MGSNPGPPPGTVPNEKKYTPEQMAQIHAAMIEELGIGRKDDLPLQDRGAPIESLRPVKVPKKLNTATAAWHTLHLQEGADPTTDALDNIADGQLARMRRGASSSGLRGNTAPRGGHFSSGNRGGRGNHSGNRGHSGRGGSSGHGSIGFGRQDSRRHGNTFTPDTFVNDARYALTGSSHLDAVHSRLRGPGVSIKLSPERQFSHGQIAPTPQNHQSKAKANVPSPKVSTPQIGRRVYTLDNDDRFFTWAGIDTALPTIALTPVVDEVSQQSTPAIGSFHQSTHVPSPPGVVNSAQTGPPTASLGNQGLSGSKWGSSTHQTVQPPGVTAKQHSLQSQDIPAPQTFLSNPSLTLVLAGRKVLRQNIVKVKKDDHPMEQEGVAAMTKKNETDDLYTLALVDPLTGKFWVDEAVSHEAVFELHGSTLTYRAAQQTGNQKPPTWKIGFQLPIYAISFANFIKINRTNAGYIDGAVSDMGHPSSRHSASVETASYSSPEVIDASMVQQSNTEHAIRYFQEPFNGPQDQNHAGFEFGDSQATGAFAQEVIDENTDNLITFGDAGETYNPPSTINPDVFDLLEAVDNHNMVENLYAALGGDEEFFCYMNQAIIARGGKPEDDVSSDKLMSDPVYKSVLQSALALLLSNLESYAVLSADYSAAFVEHQSPKILEFAISRRCMALGLSLTVAENDIVGSRLFEEKVTTPLKSTKPERKEADLYQALCQPTDDSANKTEVEQSSVVEDTRIKYSTNYLLGLRDNAVAVDISEQPPRERRPAGITSPRITVASVTIPLPVTTVVECQTFSAVESNSYIPGMEDRTVSAPAAPTQEQDVTHATSQAPEILTSVSREATTVVPTMSTVNQWQSFAAKEPLKTTHDSPETPAAAPNGVPAKAVSSTTPLNAWQAFAAAANSKTAAQVIPAAVSNTQCDKLKSLQDRKTAPESSFSSITADLVASSTNVSQVKGQRTDHALWAAMLGSVSTPEPVIKSEPQISKATLRHHPSKSDINERLAESFSGLNIYPTASLPSVEATTPIVEQFMVSPKAEVKVQSTPKSTLMAHGEVFGTVAAAPTPASQAMKDKIAAALKQPLVASPVQSPASSFSRRSAISGLIGVPKSQLKSDIEVKFESVDSFPVTLVKSEPDTKPSLTREVASSAAVMIVKTPNVSSSPQMVPVKALVVNSQKTEFGGPLPSIVQPAKPIRALDENINKVLKGAPGLSASKWADESVTPHFTNNPQIAPSSFQPISQGGMYYPQEPHTNRVPTPGYAPVMATVLVRNDDGSYREVTGMVKAGSVPIVAHAPIPQMGHQPYVENVRPSSGHGNYSNFSPASPFPARPSTYHHSSVGAVNAESKINPVAPPFKPSPQRPQVSAPADQRPALSPRRLQSQIQSRLNSSLNGPRNFYHGPQL